jgi:hypothetical protein
VTWAMQNLDPTKKDPSKIPLLLAIKEVHSSRSCVHSRENSLHQDVNDHLWRFAHVMACVHVHLSSSKRQTERRWNRTLPR